MIPYATPDEIFTFWRHQHQEHFLFLYLGLKDTQFKLKSLEYAQHWQNAQLNDQLLNLMQRSRNLLTDLHQFLKQPPTDPLQSIGIRPSLVDHFLDELNYFQSKLFVGLSPEQEQNFFRDMYLDHAAATAGDLDPMYRSEIRRGLDLSEILEKCQLSEVKSLGEQVTKYVQELRLNPEVPTLTSPELQYHIDLENCLALQILQQI